MIGDGQRQLRDHFLKLGNDWYVAELGLKDPQGRFKQEVYFDVLLHRAGNAIEMYQPACDSGITGIEDVHRDNDACEIKSLSGLKAVAKNVIERISRGELNEPPEVFRPA